MNLNRDDIELIARRVVALIGERLTSATPPPGVQTASVITEAKGPQARLAYTLKELCSELSLSPDSVGNLEAQGRIRALPGIRRKIYSRAEVERLLAGGNARW
jgi:hypothetical protein